MIFDYWPDITRFVAHISTQHAAHAYLRGPIARKGTREKLPDNWPRSTPIWASRLRFSISRSYLRKFFCRLPMRKKPAAFARFSSAILTSDGVHLVTPEYNGGAPGVLKYFIDMLKFPEAFEQRPVAFTGLAAGQWGALRPVEQLAAIIQLPECPPLSPAGFLAGDQSTTFSGRPLDE